MTRKTFLLSFAVPLFAQMPAPVPAYQSEKDAKGKLPPPLPAARFQQQPYVARGYQIAREIPAVLAQQPCYCFCDRSIGHKSLYSCFVDDHAAHCDVCLKSAYYSYDLTKQGKSPAEIRKTLVAAARQSQGGHAH